MTTTIERRSELWQRIRIARNLADFTQLEISTEMRVSRPAITFWENKSPVNRTRPSAEQMQQFAQLTGVPISLLLDDSLSPEQFEQRAASARLVEQNPPQRPAEKSTSTALSQAFWSAVRFHVIAEAPELAIDFDVEVLTGALGLRAAFRTNGHVCCFSHADDIGHGGQREQLQRETGALMLLERASIAGTKHHRTGMTKHLMIFQPRSAHYAVPGLDEYEATFGVKVFVTNDVPKAAAYLLAMRRDA